VTTRAIAAILPPKRAAGRRRFLQRFVRQPLAMTGLVYLVLIALVAALAPLLVPHDPNVQDLRGVLQPPSAEHLLGTDELGRDVLSRLIMGSRVSLLAAVQGTAVAIAIGLPLGLIAGYVRGRTDRVVMILTDTIMALPALVLAMAIVAIWGPSLTNAMLAIGIITAPRALRLVRGSVLHIREETYIEASRSIGTPDWKIIVKHVLPNAAAPLIVFTAVLAGTVMLMEAGLSFIGLGVQPPEASWGAMLGTSFRYLSRAPILAIYPGLAIAVTVLALNLVGDGVRDSIGKQVQR
jgi:ABC-type dipeptide/oligopeptide/nickel transport systems, permease components